MVGLGFWARRKLTERPDDHVPTKIQLFWETVVGQVNSQVEANLGRLHPYVVPLAISLFFFILFANWLELIPTELNDEHAPAARAHRRHQPHLRDGPSRHGQRVDLRHPEEGRQGLLQALPRAVPVDAPARASSRS